MARTIAKYMASPPEGVIARDATALRRAAPRQVDRRLSAGAVGTEKGDWWIAGERCRSLGGGGGGKR